MKKKTLIVVFILLITCTLLYSEERGLQILANQLDENLQIGKQYFLIIGIDRYEQWMPLQNPVSDAKEIKNILTSRYYVDEVIELYDEDASKANILRTFRDLQEKLEINDSLFIYYAGHGHLDYTTNSGYWIPVNAGIDDLEQSNWISNGQILGLISNIKASHICLISDSCFSGDILSTFRGITPNEFDIPYYREAYKLTSRQILTSGASESVPDVSEFSHQLKMALEKNNDSFIDPLVLFNQIRLGVSETLPLFGSLNGTGHQDGSSFILFLKDNAQEPVITEDTMEQDEVAVRPENKPTEDKGPRRMEENYFSSGAGFDFVIPVGDYNELMTTGYRPVTFFNFNIVKDWGVIGIGFVTGVTIESTEDGLSPAYSFYTIPIGASVEYATNFGIPFYGFVELSGGVNINIVNYDDDEENTASALPFIEPSIGIGFYFTPRINLSAYCGLRMMFIDGTTFSGLTPGIKFEANF